MPATLHTSHIKSLALLHSGKVRDIYDIDEQHMLIITTDRISAFDVIMPTPIAGKGIILNQVTQFWMNKLSHIIPNQQCELKLEDVLPDANERAEVADHAMIVKKLKALPIEAIVRGYLIGSGWKDYQATGAVCGIEYLLDYSWLINYLRQFTRLHLKPPLASMMKISTSQKQKF